MYVGVFVHRKFTEFFYLRSHVSVLIYVLMFYIFHCCYIWAQLQPSLLIQNFMKIGLMVQKLNWDIHRQSGGLIRPFLLNIGRQTEKQ